jgi:nucleoside-diphosphate-sugar epimerase
LMWIGSGENRLSMVHVTDVVEAARLAAASPSAAGETFNIAADNLGMTQREFIETICRQLDLPLPRRRIGLKTAMKVGLACEWIAHLSGFRVVPPLSRLSALLLGGDRRYSNDKIQKLLGWSPQVSISHGLSTALAERDAWPDVSGGAP